MYGRDQPQLDHAFAQQLDHALVAAGAHVAFDARVAALELRQRRGQQAARQRSQHADRQAATLPYATL